MEPTKRLLFWLLEGTKGGPTRIQLLSLLAKKPMNMRQLALAANLDYKTVEHHVRLMEKNLIIERMGSGYGKMYFVSDMVLGEKDIMGKIRGDGYERKKAGKKQRRRR
ncbi:MAG: winged helix-turn-helix domain-containing protein [Candidatus Micrarchaeota archaeon]|nr:winged helix-turn-helix domain-containing protein [Candidatus Micrarchaeota archaeon]